MKQLLPVLILLLATTTPLAALENPELSGSLRSLSQIVEASPLFPQRLFILSGTLRLSLVQQLSQDIAFEGAVENQWLYENPAGVFPLTDETHNTSVDLTANWGEDENWSGRLHTDRLYLRGRHGDLRWSLGRQPYGFGNIVLFSPLDIVAPFAPDVIDSEFRPGIDALRIDFATHRGDLLSYVAVWGDQPQHNSYLATGSFNFSGIDLLMIAGSLRERTLGGMGLAGNLGGLGVKTELAWYAGKDVGEAGGDLYEDFPVAATELWYRFDNDLIVLVEYLHNGAGAERPENYPQAAASAPLAEGLSSLLGQNYLLLAPSLELHPLLAVSLLGIWNIDDDSRLLRPQFTLSLSDNLSVDVSYTHHSGDEPQPTSLPGISVPQSEFGSYGDSAALFLRWYF